MFSSYIRIVIYRWYLPIFNGSAEYCYIMYNITAKIYYKPNTIEIINIYSLSSNQLQLALEHCQSTMQTKWHHPGLTYTVS